MTRRSRSLTRRDARSSFTYERLCAVIAASFTREQFGPVTAACWDRGRNTQSGWPGPLTAVSFTLEQFGPLTAACRNRERNTHTAEDMQRPLTLL